jgi:wyosine [tRNA(Phe)-imidazoG37] synthetase (radical SAM superfamily)
MNKQHSGFRHIFGPVPSRRLGRSLGVDLVSHKTCTLNCVYCECGRTDHLTINRSEYVPVAKIKAELDTFLSQDSKLDFITFSGSGEPTLNSGIGEIVGFIKSAYPWHKIALLTNGTLFHNFRVRKEILDLDIVKVSLDAASEGIFRKINRPHHDIKLPDVIKGLISLRKQFDRQLWVEVFLVPGLNDSESELKEIRNVLSTIAPDRIQLNTIDRPGAESWVKPVNKKVLTDIAAFLYDAEIINEFDSDQYNRVNIDDFYERLLATIKRRPCTAEDISRFLGIHMKEVRRHLYALIEKGEIARREMPRGIFYMKRS